MKKSYYSQTFTNEKNSGHLILVELEKAMSPEFNISLPELDVNDIIEGAPLFRLGSQTFTSVIPNDKASRFIMGDVKTDSGIPTSFTVGFALLCLMADNYHKPTRAHLVDSVRSFLIDDNGQPKIKEFSMEQYMTLLKMQEALKLPVGSLTDLVGNSRQLAQELDPASAIRLFNKQQGVIRTYMHDGYVHITNKAQKYIDPHQGDLFDIDKNKRVFSKQQDDNLSLFEDLPMLEAQLETPMANTKTNNDKEDDSLLAQILSTFSATPPVSQNENTIDDEKTNETHNMEVEEINKVLEHQWPDDPALIEQYEQEWLNQTPHEIDGNMNSIHYHNPVNNEVVSTQDIEVENTGITPHDIPLEAYHNDAVLQIAAYHAAYNAAHEQQSVPDLPSVDETTPDDDVNLQEVIAVVEQAISEQTVHIEAQEPEIEEPAPVKNDVETPSNNDFVVIERVDEAPNNQTDIRHEVKQGNLEVLNQIVQIEDYNERVAGIISFIDEQLNVLVEEPSTKGIELFAIACDKLLQDDKNFDLSQTFNHFHNGAELADDDEFSVRMEAVEKTLNYKYNGANSIPLFEFENNPYLSFYNVVVDNNIINARSFAFLQNEYQVEQIMGDYANNGALLTYLQKDMVHNDFDNSFSAKATMAQTGVNQLSKIARYVNNEETMNAILVQLNKVDNQAAALEQEQLMTILSSDTPIKIGKKEFCAGQVMRDLLLGNMEDMLSNSIPQERVNEILKISIKGACKTSNDPTQKRRLGEVLRGIQNLADDPNSLVQQEFVDNVYKDLVSVMTGSTLAYTFTPDEMKRYGLDERMNYPQKSEYRSAIKKINAEENTNTQSLKR